jgi:GrpB-like predicted nucleotidyltransferase (UPF0157 family)
MANDSNIGLGRRTVKLVPHDPKWAECFVAEEQLLLQTLGEKVLEVRHIGSTSIPGVPAKPIIDILAAVPRLADVEAFSADLRRLGYEDKGSGGVEGRRYFVKGTEARRTHHLNFCERDGFFWRSHLVFRDYLVRHPDAAAEYSALKRELAARFPTDRAAYTNGKETFVRAIVELAMKAEAFVRPIRFPTF